VSGCTFAPPGQSGRWRRQHEPILSALVHLRRSLERDLRPSGAESDRLHVQQGSVGWRGINRHRRDSPKRVGVNADGIELPCCPGREDLGQSGRQEPVDRVPGRVRLGLVESSRSQGRAGCQSKQPHDGSSEHQDSKSHVSFSSSPVRSMPGPWLTDPADHLRIECQPSVILSAPGRSAGQEEIRADGWDDDSERESGGGRGLPDRAVATGGRDAGGSGPGRARLPPGARPESQPAAQSIV
jgi:hypothetical protein